MADAPVTTASADVAAPTEVPAKAAEGSAKAPEVKGQIFKINGKEWSENDLAQRIQKAEGLEKRVADADRYEKAFNSFAAKVDDPAQFIELLNSKEFKYDEDKQASLLKSMLETKKPKLVQAVKQWLYENEVEPSTLTEEQRKLRELEKENTRFKTEAQKSEDRRKADELAAESQKIWNDYRIKIGQGIKVEGLPETEAMVVRVARKAMLMRRAGQPADIPAAVKSVRSELQAEYLTNLDKASAERDFEFVAGIRLEEDQFGVCVEDESCYGKSEPQKKEASDHPFKRKTKVEASSKENKQFWKDVSRGVFAA